MTSVIYASTSVDFRWSSRSLLVRSVWSVHRTCWGHCSPFYVKKEDDKAAARGGRRKSTSEWYWLRGHGSWRSAVNAFLQSTGTKSADDPHDV